MPHFVIRYWTDTYRMQRCTREYAAGIGFSKCECSELAIVASELTSNIVKYAGAGTIDLDEVCDVFGSGIVVTAADEGTPLKDLTAALTDGWSDQGPIEPADLIRRKGFGGGLGAVVRFTHSLHVEPAPVGKRIRVVRYLRAPKV